jgi:hypothetical protein
MDLENELVGESAWRSVGWGGLTSPYDEIDVLVVVPPSSAPPGLVARSRRVVHLADADSVVPTAMLAELRASLPGWSGSSVNTRPRSRWRRASTAPGSRWSFSPTSR